MSNCSEWYYFATPCLASSAALLCPEHAERTRRSLVRTLTILLQFPAGPPRTGGHEPANRPQHRHDAQQVSPRSDSVGIQHHVQFLHVLSLVYRAADNQLCVFNAIRTFASSLPQQSGFIHSIGLGPLSGGSVCSADGKKDTRAWFRATASSTPSKQHARISPREAAPQLPRRSGNNC